MVVQELHQPLQHWRPLPSWLRAANTAEFCGVNFCGSPGGGISATCSGVSFQVPLGWEAVQVFRNNSVANYSKGASLNKGYPLA